MSFLSLVQVRFPLFIYCTFIGFYPAFLLHLSSLDQSTMPIDIVLFVCQSHTKNLLTSTFSNKHNDLDGMFGVQSSSYH